LPKTTRRPRFRHFFSWQFLVALRGVVDEGGNDGCDLFEIGLDEVIVHVHVTVVVTRIVLDRILDKLESRVILRRRTTGDPYHPYY
jgi:hypothetical protein